MEQQAIKAIVINADTVHAQFTGISISSIIMVVSIPYWQSKEKGKDFRLIHFHVPEPANEMQAVNAKWLWKQKQADSSVKSCKKIYFCKMSSASMTRLVSKEMFRFLIEFNLSVWSCPFMSLLCRFLSGCGILHASLRWLPCRWFLNQHCHRGSYFRIESLFARTLHPLHIWAHCFLHLFPW